jgi:DHA1 family bicyclomycin/chloramphenicol resistance-like MFS transporter
VAGRITPKRQIRNGFVIMLCIGVVNLVANLLFTAHVSWALFPLGIFAFGWAMMVPVVTLLVLDLYPERRGMASSLQSFIGSLANAIVAGAISPLVMHSAVSLATASICMMGIGLVAYSPLGRGFFGGARGAAQQFGHWRLGYFQDEHGRCHAACRSARLGLATVVDLARYTPQW